MKEKKQQLTLSQDEAIRWQRALEISASFPNTTEVIPSLGGEASSIMSPIVDDPVLI